jgi:C1A family cysteine protease
MDQGDVGACSAHAITAALRFILIKQGKPDIALSRLQLYYDERVVEGTVASDAGAELRNGLKCAAKLGVAHEPLWPYNPLKFKSKPTKRVYADALKFTALTYERVEVNVAHIKAALASGFPVIIGISIFDAFESDAVAQTAMVPMPAPTDAPLGGHAMLAVGYGQKPGCFTVLNSWNTDWGDKGYCYIPEAYLGDTDLGSDYWTITSLKVS